MRISRTVIIRVGAIVFIGSSTWFMLQAMRADWSAVAEYSWKISLPLALLSLALLVFSSLLNIKAAHVLCGGMGGSVSFRQFLRIFCVAQLGRYVPGKLWSVAGFGLMLQREGCRHVSALALPVILQALMIAVFLFLGAVLTGREILSRVWGGIPLLAAGIASIFIALAFCLPLCLKFIPVGGKKGLDSLSWPFEIHLRAMALLTGCGMLLAVAFVLFVMSCVDVPRSQEPFVGGSIIAAQVISWVIFVVPGGIGVREGALALLLSTLFSPGVAVFVAAASRIWTTVAEALLLVFALLAARARRGETHRSPLERGCR